MICHYETSASTKTGVEANAPNLTQVLDATTNAPLCPILGDLGLLGNINPSSWASLTPSRLHSRSLVSSDKDDGAFHFRVCEIIRSYGRYVDDTTATYFQGVHQWLPIISRSRFHDRLMLLQSPASADFSILLLSMSLITHKTVCTSHGP